MTDYIERERALAMLHKDEFGTPDERWHPESEIAEAILRVPAADVAPVRHGRWITPTVINGRSFKVPHCSACDGVPCGVDESTKFCPNCGAKMDGGGDDD